jgi:hypothetical protein
MNIPILNKGEWPAKGSRESDALKTPFKSVCLKMKTLQPRVGFGGVKEGGEPVGHS